MPIGNPEQTKLFPLISLLQKITWNILLYIINVCLKHNKRNNVRVN